MWRHAAPAYGFECRDRNGRVGERRAQLKGMGWAALPALPELRPWAWPAALAGA